MKNVVKGPPHLYVQTFLPLCHYCQLFTSLSFYHIVVVDYTTITPAPGSATGSTINNYSFVKEHFGLFYLIQYLNNFYTI